MDRLANDGVRLEARTFFEAGESDLTAAIQRAIDTVHGLGGGEVIFPAGEYGITTLRLRDNVRLSLEPGSLLRADPRSEAWRVCDGQPLIHGKGVSNAGIEGRGTLDCGGVHFHAPDGTRLAVPRPHTTVLLEDCRHVFLKGIRIQDSVGWTVHLDRCVHAVIDGITIRNRVARLAKNTDGIDVNGCSHVLIQNCDIETGDDAICLKNMDLAEPARKRPEMHDIRVYNCTLATTCNATKIGTETRGHIRDVLFDGITVKRHTLATGVDYPAQGERPIAAISVQSNDGACVRDIAFRNYDVHEVDAPFFLLLGNRQSKAAHAEMGVLDNVSIENMEVREAHRASLINVYEGGCIGSVLLENIVVHNMETRVAQGPPERPDERYPEPWQYGVLPAHGLFARDVRTLTLQGCVTFPDAGNSGRPPLVLENVTELRNGTAVIPVGAADGSGVHTQALQKAIDRCPKGGSVYVQPGTYRTGALFLKSDMTLFLSQGATLVGSEDPSDYPVLPCRFEGAECPSYASLINAGTLRGEKIENLCIAGFGKLDGSGSALLVREEAEAKGKRGRVLCVRNGCDVRVTGITVRQSPGWCVHFIYCDRVRLDGVRIFTKEDEHGVLYAHIHNGDGVDIDSTSRVQVINCGIASQDDCISIKSGRDLEGRRIGIPSRDIAIEACRFESGNGITIGSEMSGGIRNVVVRNCMFHQATSLASVKAPRGRGGVVDGLAFEDIDYYFDVPFHECLWYRAAINVDHYYSVERFDPSVPAPFDETTPQFRNIAFKNISLVCKTGRSVWIGGLPESPVRNIRFENAVLEGAKPFLAHNVDGLSLDNVWMR